MHRLALDVQLRDRRDRFATQASPRLAQPFYEQVPIRILPARHHQVFDLYCSGINFNRFVRTSLDDQDHAVIVLGLQVLANLSEFGDQSRFQLAQVLVIRQVLKLFV